MDQVVFLVRARNNAPYVADLCHSLAAQKSWENAWVLYMDDASTDGSADLAEQLLAEVEVPYRVVRRAERIGALRQTMLGVRQIDGMNTIVACVDGDDALCRVDTIELLQKAYAEGDPWVVHTQQQSAGWTRGTVPEAVQNRFVRGVTWTNAATPLGHLRTARRWLWDLVDYGAADPYDPEDCVICYCLYEMAAPEKVKVLPEACYWYRVPHDNDGQGAGRMDATWHAKRAQRGQQTLTLPPKQNIVAGPLAKGLLPLWQAEKIAGLLSDYSGPVVVANASTDEVQRLRSVGVQAFGVQPDPRVTRVEQVAHNSIWHRRLMPGSSLPIVLHNVLDTISWDVNLVAEYLKSVKALTHRLIVAEDLATGLQILRDQRIDLRTSLNQALARAGLAFPHDYSPSHGRAIFAL